MIHEHVTNTLLYDLYHITTPPGPTSANYESFKIYHWIDSWQTADAPQMNTKYTCRSHVGAGDANVLEWYHVQSTLWSGIWILWFHLPSTRFVYIQSVAGVVFESWILILLCKSSSRAQSKWSWICCACCCRWRCHSVKLGGADASASWNMIRTCGTILPLFISHQGRGRWSAKSTHTLGTIAIAIAIAHATNEPFPSHTAITAWNGLFVTAWLPDLRTCVLTTTG